MAKKATQIRLSKATHSIKISSLVFIIGLKRMKKRPPCLGGNEEAESGVKVALKNLSLRWVLCFRSRSQSRTS